MSSRRGPDRLSFLERFEDLLTAARIHDLREAVVDYRALGGQGSAVQEILYALRVADLYHEHLVAGGRPLRLAYVGSAAFVGGWAPGLAAAREAGLDAFVTLTEALQLASTPHFPSELRLLGYRSAYPIDASQAIRAAIDDRRFNLFRTLFQTWVIPQIRRE